MSNLILSAVPRQSRPSGVWDYISPSRLNLWLKCPLAFKLRYIDGVPSPTPPAAFVGKMVHRGLETFYRARQQGVWLDSEDLQFGLANCWEQAVHDERVQFESEAIDTSSREQVQQLLKAYVVQLPADEPQPLAVEATSEAPLVDPTTGESLGIPLLGIMDLVLPDPSGPIVADFKTAARASSTLEIMHEIQLSCYAYLLRSAFGEPESALEIRSLIKTKIPKIETTRFPARSSAHMRRLFAVVRRYLDDLDSGNFVFRPGILCSSCEFEGTRCQGWQS